MKVRKAVVSDAYGVAKVHVDSWKATYQGIVPDEFLETLTYEHREKAWAEIISKEHVFVAEAGEEIIGFSSGGKERSAEYEGYDGELYAIYILEEHQGQGIGKRLVKPVVEELKNMNIDSMLVCVLKDNRAGSFYEKLGGTLIGTGEIDIAGKKLSEYFYGWRDIGKIELLGGKQ